MKTSVYVQLLAVASVSLAPFAVFAGNVESAQACVNAFVTQNFPAETSNIRIAVDNAYNIDSPMTTPLSMSNINFSMKLSATDAVTGQVIAAATCTEKRGVLKLSSNYSVAVVASR